MAAFCRKPPSNPNRGTRNSRRGSGHPPGRSQLRLWKQCRYCASDTARIVPGDQCFDVCERGRGRASETEMRAGGRPRRESHLRIAARVVFTEARERMLRSTHGKRSHVTEPVKPGRRAYSRPSRPYRLGQRTKLLDDGGLVRYATEGVTRLSFQASKRLPREISMRINKQQTPMKGGLHIESSSAALKNYRADFARCRATIN